MNVLYVVDSSSKNLWMQNISFLLLLSVYLGSEVIALTIAIVIVFAIACVNKPQEVLLWRQFSYLHHCICSLIYLVAYT